MWTGDTYLERLYDQAAGQREFEAAGETPEQRKNRLKRSLRDSLGEFERELDFSPEVLERVQCDGYIRERVELSAIPGLTFGAYVLIPDGMTGKLPGVIAVHGHGYGSRQICGMLEDGTPDTGKPGIYNHFAVQLVRKGMVVIAPDVIGFGERRMQADLAKDPDAPSSCYRMSTQLLMLGKTLTGLRVTEMLKTLDYFSTREEIDPERIGIVGFSGGSLISYVTAALDERIGAAVLIGFPNTFKDSIIAIQHCICNYTPGILMQAELPELMGLIAPRPLFLESGDEDPIFPAAGFSKAVRELQAIYGSEEAEERFACDLFHGVHEVSGQKSFDWLKLNLS
ncbi:alpha/beta hydrolase family protein [Paenibacillus sp. sptzw28]|uniref:dienelactone hydrolase family protein n=1 Tax=Paenibacillus sp. sptzw28 TaxID=715179 RepID=UPI001C6EF2FC|nr:alpha/beta hydrolase family protein [Paenibacillus sp. sptzw28]QYR19465.1 alpha/beta hydrolase family protein [Paenibacillus sp. sptzw28]